MASQEPKQDSLFFVGSFIISVSVWKHRQTTLENKIFLSHIYFLFTVNSPDTQMFSVPHVHIDCDKNNHTRRPAVVKIDILIVCPVWYVVCVPLSPGVESA